MLPSTANGMLPPSAITKGVCKISFTPKACGGQPRFDQDVVRTQALGSKVRLATTRPEY